MSISLDLGGGMQLQVQVRTSSRARRLRLVSSIEGIHAVVPPGFSHAELSEFLASKQEWLRRTSHYFEQLRQKTGPFDGSTLFFRGEKYRSIIVGDSRFSATVSDALRTITFHIPDRRRPRQYQEEWYRQQTEHVIQSRLPELAARMGLKYNRVSIKRQKSRWGSCSRKGNLNFNLMLSAAPAEVFDYVIIHELAHLKFLNHSAAFWAEVEAADPEFREHREWLSTFAPLIKVG